MALTGIAFGRDNFFISRKDPSYSERASKDIDFAREQGATIFHWRAIPNGILTRIADMQAQSSMTMGDLATQTFNARTAARNREAFRYGVHRIENYADENGEPIEAITTNILEGGEAVTVLSDATMNAITLNVISEIGAVIFNQNTMGEDERKKFEGALSQFGVSDISSAATARKPKGKSAAAKPRQSSTPKTRKAKSTRTGKTPQTGPTKTDVPEG